MRRALAILASLAAVMPAASAHAQTRCEFVLGFSTLQQLVGPAVVGACQENQRFNPANGNAEQKTAGGLMVWRKADNWTAFTDGYRTWLNGPNGVEVRLNTEKLVWEGGSAV